MNVTKTRLWATRLANHRLHFDGGTSGLGLPVENHQVNSIGYQDEEWASN